MFARFRKDQRGIVAPTVAIVFVALAGFVGLALDYGRATALQTEMQRFADAVVIQAARTLTTTGDASKAETAAAAHLNGLLTANNHSVAGDASNAGPANGAIEATISVGGSSGVVTAVLKTKSAAPFMSFFGRDGVDIDVTSEARTSTKVLDIALMVDTTGSMGWSDNTVPGSQGGDGTRMGAMRVAAKDLLSILMPAGDNPNIRMSVVPFSEHVHLDRKFMARVTGKPETRTETYQERVTRTTRERVCRREKQRTGWRGYCQRYWYNKPSCYRTRERCSNENVTRTTLETRTRTLYLKTCLSERTGSITSTDDAPTTGFPDPGYTTNASEACALPAAPIQPLTNSKTTLDAKISSLTDPSGGTAGHLGTAWSWYTISPNFASVWEASQRPLDYADGRAMKAVVLMTDGDYTLHHGDRYCNGRDPCSRARQDARALCTAMKAEDKNVMVFAVGFGLVNSDRPQPHPSTLPEGDARRVLYDCAGEGRYFFPYDGNALRQAFRDIGTALAAAQGQVTLTN
ncbi:MAG: pilus assembly protein TadG-related protein [Pseudomonadota bacterium]